MIPPDESDSGVAAPGRARPAQAGTWGDIALFLVVAFVGAGGLGALQPVVGVDPVVIQIVQFAPALGVLAVVVLRWRRPEAWPEVRVSLGLSRGVVARMGAMLGFVAVVLGGAAVLALPVKGWVDFTDPTALSAPIGLIVVAQFVGACGEEIGWRCYLQPRLGERIGVLPAGVVVGLVWGVWHVQIFAVGWAYAGAFLLFSVAMSVVLAVTLHNAARGGLLVAGLLHALVNLGLLVLFAEESGSAIDLGLLALPGVLLAAAAAAGYGLRARHARG